MYNDEINLIEVELLGREHYERMQRDRQVAEETGAAQLQRLQENILQTRQKYNRAKHQYYFPLMKGFKYVLTISLSCYFLHRSKFLLLEAALANVVAKHHFLTLPFFSC